MLPFTDDYLRAKNERYQLVFSSFIANQRILQSDWMWDATKHIQPKNGNYLYAKKKKKKKKRTKIIWFFPQILMIKEFCNLIGWEAQLATPNQKRKFQMLHFLDSYPHAKNLRHQWIPSGDTDDQRIPQSDWLRVL